MKGSPPKEPGKIRWKGKKQGKEGSQGSNGEKIQDKKQGGGNIRLCWHRFSVQEKRKTIPREKKNWQKKKKPPESCEIAMQGSGEGGGGEGNQQQRFQPTRQTKNSGSELRDRLQQPRGKPKTNCLKDAGARLICGSWKDWGDKVERDTMGPQ